MKIIKFLFRIITFIPKFIILALFQIITFICGISILPWIFSTAMKKRQDPYVRKRPELLAQEVYDELDPIFFLRFFDNTIERLKAWTFCRPINPANLH